MHAKRRATPGLSRADQCRELGLQVGDTIEGRTEYESGYWSEARLRLLWIGDQCASFIVSERNVNEPEWSRPRESFAWSLEFRDWRKV